MPILAMYDVLKIQNFVFNSNKTKENCGASIIVQTVFEKGLANALPKNSFLDWRERPFQYKMAEDNGLAAEIIYVGGGNAMVVYKDIETAKRATERLSQYILDQSGGMLQFAVSYDDDIKPDGFHEDQKNLFIELKKNKAQKRYSYPMLGIAITRLGITDGLPAVIKDGDDHLSKSADLKRKAFHSSGHYFAKKLGHDYHFETEFDKMGQKEGENYIAVVHIDGNNMGKTLDTLLATTGSYKQAVPLLREFSKILDQTFIDAFKAIVDKLLENQKKEEFQKKFDLKNRGDKPILRPIVLNGDDVTFVCNGKLGITLAEHFLRELNGHSPMKLVENNKEVPISACAGVAIVKSHFPFYRAYKLAEELCKSAKDKGKIVAKKEGKEVGSWLDYHIVYSGVTTRLQELREQAYNLPGQEAPDKIEYSENGNEHQVAYLQYNLLWRPWCVVGQSDAKYNWENFKAIHKLFKEDWTRSRLKTLRNTFIKSEQDVKSLLAHYKSRGYELPDFNGKKEPFPENRQTPYFDVLEMLDFFVELKEDEGGEE